MEGDLGWYCSSGGGGSNNWDLHAVVRFACGGARRAAQPPPLDDSSWFPQPQPLGDEEVDVAQWKQLPTGAATADDLCRGFFAGPVPPQPQSPQISSPRNEAAPQQPPAEDPPAKPQTSGRGGGGRTARSKRKSKKSQVSKEVTRVPAGAPAPDLWAWRKYGQKPIKGSPYPRGYYRCSTDKDCKARKQVERCRTDPTTLIVTYTGEHSHPVPLHRNSLAGTTRGKMTLPPAPSPPPADEPTSMGLPSPTNTKLQTSPSASAGLSPPSPTTRLRSTSEEYDAEEDDDAISVRLMLEDVVMATPEDALLFLKSDEPAQEPGQGGGFEDVMPFPKPDESSLATRNGCDDVMLFPKPDDPSPGSGNGGGYEDVMLFPKPDEAASMTGGSRMDGGAAACPVMNIVEKFCVSGLPEWGAAATSWGC